MDLLDLELAALLIGAWLASLAVLWKTVGRPGRPGLVTNPLAIDVMMLMSVACLIVGLSFLVKGAGLFN